SPAGTAGRNLPAATGATGGNPQARRRKTPTRHSHRVGPAHPASHPASAGPPLRPHLLAALLRLPPRQERPPGTGAGAGIRGSGSRLGGGPGPGEVLRPRQPRPAAGPARAKGGRPALAAPDS